MSFVGFFTDRSFRLRVIVSHRVDPSKRIVYCSYHIDDERFDAQSHARGVLQLNDDGMCSFSSENEDGLKIGQVDEALDRIIWDTGDIWQKLEVSSEQIRVVSFRSYVPLTFVVFVWIITMCQHLCQHLKLCFMTKQPKINVVYSKAHSKIQ